MKAAGRATVALLAGLAAFGVAGCTQLTWPDQPDSTNSTPVELTEAATVGQTILALEGGLSGVEIYLEPQGTPAGELRLTLQRPPETPGAGVDLAAATLPGSSITQAGYYRFSFPPQSESRLEAYYLRLAYAGAGELRVGHGPADAYQQGALYRNDAPDGESQMAFRLVYDPVGVAAAIGGQALVWAGWLGLATLLFVIPGWGLLVWLWPASEPLAWGEQLGLAIGLSIAIYPILFLWTSLVGLRLGWLYAALPPGLGAFLMIAWVIRRRPWSAPGRPSRPWRSPHFAADLALVATIGLVFLTRFWAARALVAPLLGDSYQHTLIAQLLVDHGGLFDSWAPYADLATFTYHFGFHTLAAVFHWWAGLPMPAAVLWLGQILNGMAVIALYPLAVRVSGQRWAGVGAVLAAGLLSPTPMIYSNWGRYTQLAGQAVLPAAVVVAWAYFSGRRLLDWRLLGLAWLAWGGLALTHYRILIFAILFAGAFWLVEVVRRRGRIQLLQTAVLGFGAGILFLPWFIHTFSGRITAGFVKQLTTAAADTPAFTQQYNQLANIAGYLPGWLWVVAILALVWGLARRERTIVVLGLWWALVVLSTNPQWLRLPGEGAISNFALLIVAYIPAAILAGAAIGWLREAAGPRRAFDYLFLVGMAVIGLWGGGQRLRDINLVNNALVTAPDVRAAAWLEQHTAPEAGILVNSFPAYGGALVAGSDAGWWLPILAHRRTNLPPLNYGNEQGPRADYRLWVNALPTDIASKGVDDPSVLSELHARGLTYVYIGNRDGRVNNATGPRLEGEQFSASSHYRLVYREDRVWIFEILE